MQTEYFVDFKIYNSKNKGWAFKTTSHSTSLKAAKKDYYTQLSTYVDSEEFTFGTVVLSDMYGNVIMSDTWGE